MSKVSFNKGLLANLPTDITAGSLYITTDERALYLDVDSATRIRIGDFQEFPTLSALTANSNPSSTALYYVTELNCLAKWDGEKYVQINIDTGATNVEVVGGGNAVTSASYNPASRKLTLTADATYITESVADQKISAGISALQGDTESTVADVDTRVCTIEDNYTDHYDLEKAVSDAIGDNPENKTVAELIAAAKNETSAKVDTLIGVDAGKSARTIANEELAKQLIPENARDSLDTLAEIAAWIQAHPDDASAMNQAIATLETLIGALPDDAASATIVAYIKEYADAAISALKISDYLALPGLCLMAAVYVENHIPWEARTYMDMADRIMIWRKLQL